PKPLSEVAGKPMLRWALQSRRGLAPSKCIFVILAEHEEQYKVSSLVRESFDEGSNLIFVYLDNVTDGQLCTVLAASHVFDLDQEILIAASDTLVEGNIATDIRNSSWDGLISVANLPGEQWSFARTDKDGNVTEVAEKVRISDHASTGLYFFRRARDLVTYGENMIKNNEKT